MFYMLILLVGILGSPFVYFQLFLYEVNPSSSLEHQKNIKESRKFFLLVPILFLVLFVLTFPLRTYFLSASSSLYVMGLYLTGFIIFYETFMWVINKKRIVPFNIFHFFHIFIVVSAMYYNVLIYNIAWKESLVLFFGFYIGFIILYVFVHNFYYNLLKRYFNPVLKNPMIGLIITMILLLIFQSILSVLPKI